MIATARCTSLISLVDEDSPSRQLNKGKKLEYASVINKKEMETRKRSRRKSKGAADLTVTKDSTP